MTVADIPARVSPTSRRAALLALGVLLAAFLASLVGCDRGSLTRSNPPEYPVDHARLVGARLLRLADGDSFQVRLADGRKTGVRIGGIDAPERNQPWADRSRRNLRELIEGKAIWLDIGKTDRYGRIVAQVFVEARGLEAANSGAAPDRLIDVGHAQLQAGLAWFYRRYAGELTPEWRKRYDDAELSAKRERSGLWQDRAPVEPWIFRERKRDQRRERRRTPSARE